MSFHLKCAFDSLEQRTLFSTGQLDPAFQSAALVNTAFDSGSSVIADVEVLPDGGILAAGVIRVRDGNKSTGETQLAVAKFNFDGSPDTSFGAGGKIAATPRSMTGAVRLQLTPDGGFIVMGSGKTNPDGPDPNDNPCVTSFASDPLGTTEMLLKFTAAGKIDARFGTNGVLKPENADTFTIDPQGRILVGGFRGSSGQPSSSAATDATLTRYTASGALDTSFNKTGQFVSLAPIIGEEDNRYQTFNSITVDSQERILAGMQVFDTTGGDEDGFAYSFTQIFRLTDSGKLDSTYAGDGTSDQIPKLRQIAGVLDDGSIILAGKTIARVDPSGKLDWGFGDNGIANTSKLGLTPGNNLYLRQANDRCVVSPEGNIVLANVSAPGALELTRITAQGQPDASFGNQGTLTVAIDSDPNAQGYLNAVDIAPDGSLVAGGQNGILSPTGKTDTRAFALARLMAGEGPALQLIPRTLKSPSRYLSMSVLIRDPDGVDVSTLDNNDLKLFDAQGNTRKIRFLSSEDVNGDGPYIRATYRIIGPNDSPWSSAGNGTYEVRLQRKQVFDDDGNTATAQVLGTVRVKIA